MSALLRLDRVVQMRGARTVLHETTLEFSAGERCGIAGASTAGKSTLARLVALRERPVRGNITLNGAPTHGLEGAGLRAARRQLQLVTQDPALSFVPHWPIWRVVAEAGLIDGEARAPARARAAALMERVGLSSGFALRTPLTLSGGERQRLAIARALYAAPRLIVFDESFSGLDQRRQHELLALLEELHAAGDLALILIAHDLRLLARFAQRLLVLDQGRVVEDDLASRMLHAPQSAAARQLVAASYGLQECLT